MTAVSALVTRAQNEIQDTTTNTFPSSMTGIAFGEMTQFCIDGIADWGNYNFVENFDQSIVTSANLRAYVVSSLNPAPVVIKKVEYVESSTAIHAIPEVDLFGGSMYLFYDDHPLYTRTAGNYFNVWYYSRHTIPGATSAQVTIEPRHEEAIVTYIKWKAMLNYSVDQRGINQDKSNEFLAMANSYAQRYTDQRRRATTTIVGYK